MACIQLLELLPVHAQSPGFVATGCTGVVSCSTLVTTAATLVTPTLAATLVTSTPAATLTTPPLLPP
ncbi:hypothetical protein SLEP1_g43396 [Rubroshorea leprosula]|uniref:Secreted protein n=1 Tax=Rubroshorea leprosula TaxID=152421 RepID=A0AAV5LCV9_9ROSI|nr:hypothetical protein SLEP1_g43396 [Rubroshorea leprosula]